MDRVWTECAVCGLCVDRVWTMCGLWTHLFGFVVGEPALQVLYVEPGVEAAMSQFSQRLGSVLSR